MHALIPQSSRFGLAQFLPSAAFSGVRTHVPHVFLDLRKSGRSAKNCPQERSKIRTPPGNLLRLAGNCAPHAFGVIAVLHVVRRTARFVSAREDRNEEKPSIGSAAMSSRLPDR
jgi:hypothetical protein